MGFRETVIIRLWAITRVPLLNWIRPRVEEINEERSIISIPLKRRNRNHLQSMYFGVLCCGADLSGGLLAMNKIRSRKLKISFVFKDFKADFLKRPESRTHFTCADGELVDALIEKCLETGERHDQTLKVIATCPKKLGDEPVAEFEITLSLKDKSKR